MCEINFQYELQTFASFSHFANTRGTTFEGSDSAQIDKNQSGPRLQSN